MRHMQMAQRVSGTCVYTRFKGINILKPLLNGLSIKACTHLHSLLDGQDCAQSASGLVDRAQSKFYTLAQYTCVGMECCLQQDSVFYSV